MKFTSITMKNYRQYKDITFDFSNNTPRGLHVIIADNGSGKSNLLNAICWCLYGDEPHTAGTDQQDIPSSADRLVIANKEAMREMREEGERYCPVSVCIEGEDGGVKYVFTRSAEIDINAFVQHGRDVYEVREHLPDGTTNIYGTSSEDAYRDVREMLLPQGIREYFFFDGDQLLDYFGVNSATANVSHLRNSIYTISQVGLVQKTREHLIEREKDTARKIRKLSTDLSKYLSDRDTAKEKRIQKQKDIKDIEREITAAENELSAVDRTLEGLKGVVEDNRRLNENKEQIAELEAELKDITEQVAQFIREYFDKLVLYDINRENDAYIRSRLAEGSSTYINVDEMQASLDNDYRCALCGEPLRPERIREFMDFVSKYQSNVMLQQLSAIHTDICKGMDIAGYAEKKHRLLGMLGKKKARIEKLTEENERLYERINLSGVEDAADLGTKKKTLTELISQSRITLGKYQEQLGELKKKEAEAEKKYLEELDKNNECEQLAKRQRFLQKAISIISDVIDGIVNAVKQQLEEKTFELFTRFVWDAGRFSRIELDDYFRLKIYDAVTGQSCLRSCSAGEKELLALSFTLAIHDVSGYDNLLFIDTPVGRLSGINRSNFSQVLKDISEKKQIILAFTDTEFSAEVAAVFTDNILSSKVILESGMLETKKKGESR